MIKLLSAFIVTLGWMVVNIVGIVLGLILVPVGYYLSGLVLVPGLVNGEWIWMFRSRALWLWGNDEEGVDGFEVHHPMFARHPTFRMVWYWSAVRNPFNNIRFAKSVNAVPEPKEYRVWWNSPKYGWLIQQRYLLGFQVRLFGMRFWFGFKFKPSDLDGPLPEWDTRAQGLGFAMQFKKDPEARRP